MVWYGIVKENVRTSIRELNLKRKWVMQLDKEAKHTSTSTKESFFQRKSLFWKGQS